MATEDADGKPKIRRIHSRVERHEENLKQHDRRISRNENWRLQAQGALKILAIIIGSGLLAALIQMALI